MSTMEIDVWMELICPNCYVGWRRFQKALRRFEHADHVDLRWHSFQSVPTAPRSWGIGMIERNVQIEGLDRDEALAIHARLRRLAADEGLPYNYELTDSGNTMVVHRLVHLAAAHGLRDAAIDHIQRAYFGEGVPIGDTEKLIGLVSEVGVDGGEARAMLAGDVYIDAVQDGRRAAAARDVKRLPTFVYSGASRLVGAESTEAHLETMRAIWSQIGAQSTAEVGAAG